MFDDLALLVIDPDDVAAACGTQLPVYTLDTALECRSQNIVIVAREDGHGHLDRMQIEKSGRVLSVPAGLGVWLAAQSGDPAQLIDGAAGDRFWHEERPIGQWEHEDVSPGVSSGIDFLDLHLRWTKSELVVVCGPYGCGKSTATRLLAYNWADKIGRQDRQRCSIVGWEDPIGIIRREVVRFAVGHDVIAPTPMQARRIIDMEGRIGWTKRHPDEKRLLEWYWSLVRYRAKHDGVRFFVFDPWNRHDQVKAPTQNETDYVRDMMQEFQKLVRDLDIIMVIVTHVAAKSYDESGRIKPFRLANAMGSSNFGSAAHRGICMCRTASLAEWSDTGAKDHMVINFDKAKNEETMGERGTVACLFDRNSMTLTLDHGATMQAKKLWA